LRVAAPPPASHLRRRVRSTCEYTRRKQAITSVKQIVMAWVLTWVIEFVRRTMERGDGSRLALPSS
jgi:hypothetical protein